MKIKSVLAFEGGPLIVAMALLLACSKKDGDTEVNRAAASAPGGGAVTLSATADANNAFKGTARVVQPVSWTSNDTANVPLLEEKNVLAAMLASFTPEQLTNAKIATTFTDVLLTTGENSYLPCIRQGVKVGMLSPASQAKVLAAIKPWLSNLDTAAAALLLRTYAGELPDTYVTYANNKSAVTGNAGLFFTTSTDYVRIDGPGVWIELVCQPGAAPAKQVRYHAVFCDHPRDYAAL
ncbi:MAG TPA: DUF3500 domain-containing protein [Chitinophaga sp.]|uniref:DUF3500 domain-containing protein n=1 Tax=Chitinophaga sp. TaxID=1869181 RepID=UPI002DBA4566|nr:DUF3500 domain-containing protein [Chitinophaga sp.]HEU4553865.1 DUF3500 domain-containing protein [Chitinophaga sp.]